MTESIPQPNSSGQQQTSVAPIPPEIQSLNNSTDVIHQKDTDTTNPTLGTSTKNVSEGTKDTLDAEKQDPSSEERVEEQNNSNLTEAPPLTGPVVDMLTAYSQCENLDQILNLSSTQVNKLAKERGIKSEVVDWIITHKWPIIGATAALSLIAGTGAADALIIHHANLMQSLTYGLSQATFPRSPEDLGIRTWVEATKGNSHNLVASPKTEVFDNLFFGLRDKGKEIMGSVLGTEVLMEQVQKFMSTTRRAEDGSLPISPKGEAAFYIHSGGKSSMLTALGAKGEHERMIPLVSNKAAAEPLVEALGEKIKHVREGVFISMGNNIETSKNLKKQLHLSLDNAIRTKDVEGKEKNYTLVVAACEIAETGHILSEDSDAIDKTMEQAIDNLGAMKGKVREQFRRGKKKTEVEPLTILVANADAVVKGVYEGQEMSIRERAQEEDIDILMDLKSLIALEIGKRIALSRKSQEQSATEKPQMHIATNNSYFGELNKGVAGLLGVDVTQDITSADYTIIHQSTFHSSLARQKRINQASDAPAFILTEETPSDTDEVNENIISIPDLVMNGVTLTRQLLQHGIPPGRVGTLWQNPPELLQVVNTMNSLSTAPAPQMGNTGV